MVYEARALVRVHAEWREWSGVDGFYEYTREYLYIFVGFEFAGD